MEVESATKGPDRALREASLRRAVRDGDLAAAAALLEVDATLARTGSERGGSLVLEASERGHDGLADALLRARDGGSMVGMDVHEAAALGRPAALRHALTEDMTAFEDVGPSGFLPLHRAAYGGHLEATTLLLEMGADPASPAANPARTSPLESVVAGAATHGPGAAFEAVARLLVAAGADPDAPLTSGSTVREVAARHGFEPLFEEPTEDGAEEASAAPGAQDPSRPVGPDGHVPHCDEATHDGSNPDTAGSPVSDPPVTGQG
ncbi:MAG: ankyrin repeat domain-containing protein [Planctomycetota bacterium]